VLDRCYPPPTKVLQMNLVTSQNGRKRCDPGLVIVILHVLGQLLKSLRCLSSSLIDFRRKKQKECQNYKKSVFSKILIVFFPKLFCDNVRKVGAGT
jgi:hypothetical protein